MNQIRTEIKYQILIPYVYSSQAVEDEADAEADAAIVAPFRKKTKKGADTVKGALFNKYDLTTHQFVALLFAHIRRIHPVNTDIDMGIVHKEQIVVKAANPLAAVGEPLHYTHSKTKRYNTIVFMTS